MVGWVLIDSKSLQPYAWVVRCSDYPPTDESCWEPLAASQCPVEGARDVGGEFLI